MNHDAEHPVFATEQGPSVPDRDSAMPAKPWVTPKVITSTLGDTAHNPNVSGDGTAAES
jgi:hypothetical protein